MLKKDFRRLAGNVFEIGEGERDTMCEPVANFSNARLNETKIRTTLRLYFICRVIFASIECKGKLGKRHYGQN